MEVFNNIWIAISTPNEMLINIISIFLAFIEAPLSLYLISTVFNIKTTKKQFLFYIIPAILISLLALFFIPNPFNIIINYVSIFLIIYFVLKLNMLKTLIATLLPSLLFNLVSILFLNPYIQLLNITHEQAVNIPIYRIPFSIFMYLAIFLLTLCIKHKKFKINILDNFSKKDRAIIILNFSFGFLYSIIQMILNFNYTDILPIGYTFFSFICLLIYFILSFYTLSRVIKLVTTTQKLESAEEYNKTLKILHDNVRGFKHDFDNIVTTIGGYITTKDIEGLENYYSQLQEDCQRVNNLYILNPEIINNPGIYNLLTSKYNEAEEKDIKVNLSFLLDLNDLHMKIYEFARILGILLDNSIEAASECDEKVLNIEFRNDSKNNRNIVLIENTYSDKDVNLDDIFNKGVSGKEDHTGLGLWEIRKILKKNNNVNLHTSKNEKYFSQQLEIYY